MTSSDSKEAIEIESVDDIPAEILCVIVNEETKITREDCAHHLLVAIRVLKLATGFNARLAPKSSLLVDPNASKDKKKEEKGKGESDDVRDRPPIVSQPLSDDALASVLPLPQEADELVDTSVLKSNYRELKTLADGGIFMVQSSYDNVLLAVKRLPHSPYDYSQQRRNYQQVRFLRYAKGHGSIVSLMRCTMYKEELWLSLECLQGGTLEEMLQQHELKEKHIKYILRQITSALAFLHESGIAFRNLSSHHVMFDLKGNAKLIDFSSAKIVNYGPVVKRERLNITSSHNYYAPELVCQKCEDEVLRQGIESDLWSLGVLAMEMLMRKLTFPTAWNALWMSAALCEENHRHGSVRGSKIECIAAILKATSSDPRAGKRWSGFAHEFLRMTLQADPRDRTSAKKLLRSDFLMKGIPSRREMCDLVGYVRQLKNEIKL